MHKKIVQCRCLAQEKLFPPDNPVWCKEQNEDPFFLMQCCDNNDLCNKDIIIKLPERGERGDDITDIINYNF